MNVLKKQLRLPSSFSGMKKAVSTSDLSDKKFSDIESLNNNLTLDSRSFKSKSPSMNTQDLADLLNNLYNTIMERSGDDFYADNLPQSLSTDWLNVKYSTENDTNVQKKNSAILELLTTELNYLNQMQFLLDVSAKVFANLQLRYFAYINVDDVFLNLGEIYEVNYQFWTAYLYPSFETAKSCDNFISCRSWKNGFNQISSMFLPYQVYCSRMTKCQKYIQSLEKDKYFSQFLQWFSRTDQSNRESLTDFIAKPFQRLTKYKLLLTTISGYSDDQNEKSDLTEMINSINLFLKQVEWKLSMAQICVRMDPMEFVDPPNEELLEYYSPYTHIDLTKTINTTCGEIMRQMIKECTFRMKEGQMKIIEITLILFTDLILICQKIKNFEVDRIKIIRPIIPLNKLDVIIAQPGGLLLRVLDDFECLASMYLITHDPGVINEWINLIQTTQGLLKISLLPKQKPTQKTYTENRSYTENRLYPALQVNIINPSPISGRSPTPTGHTFPNSPISQQQSQFNRSSLNGSDIFSRSNFRSSPVIRRRLNANGSSEKGRTESLHESYSPTYESISINRSMSQQHYTRSQMSILEDDLDCEEHLHTIESSMSSIILESPPLSILNEVTVNGDNQNYQKSDINIKDGKNDKLIKMRAYGSMMNLSMDI